MAGVVGFEPTMMTVLETVAIGQAMRYPYKSSGAEGSRTPYLRNANATLCQMSYSPILLY